MARHITIPTSRRNSATLNKESDEEIRSHAIGDNYLDEEIKTVSPQPNRDFRSPLEISPPMQSLCCRPTLSRGSCRMCSVARLNSLKSWMGQNVNSPFGNICAVTFKLYSRSRRIAVANRLTFSSRPLAYSP